MPHRRHAPFTPLILLLVLLAGFGVQGLAASSGATIQVAQNSESTEARARLSASEAAAIAQKQVGGKVMSVNTRQRNGRVIYQIKVLQDSGRMRTVNVDGNTGKIN